MELEVLDLYRHSFKFTQINRAKIAKYGEIQIFIKSLNKVARGSMPFLL